MRLIFCGSGIFAVPSFRAILKTEHELVRVFSQPSRPAGRGGKLRATPLAQAAEQEGLEVTECANINTEEFISQIRRADADLIVIVDFGQLIKSPVRDAARLGAINLHGSILPQLRGAAPVNWAIIRGYEKTGVTTFSLVDKMDAGDIHFMAETQILPHETADELKIRLSEVGSEVICKTIEKLTSGQTQGEKQDESKATLAPKLEKSDGIIDWTAEAVTIRNQIHGTWPWPGGHAVFRHVGGKERSVVIARAESLDQTQELPPGQVDEDLLVATGKGRLKILEIKPAGKRLMAWKDFVNGYRVTKGDKFIRQ